MLRRLLKVLASMTTVGAIIIALLVVGSIAGQTYQFRSTPSNSNIDVYTLPSNSGEPIQCHRDNSGFTVTTHDNGEILWAEPISSGAELKRCIEAFKSGTLPFDPRNYIGSYEAGYISWEGFDHENIYDWDSLPEECEPHYQFKRKSHPWIVDAFGLVETIDVTFQWTGTDPEWKTCFAARLKQIAEIDLSKLEMPAIDSAPN